MAELLSRLQASPDTVKRKIREWAPRTALAALSVAAPLVAQRPTETMQLVEPTVASSEVFGNRDVAVVLLDFDGDADPSFKPHIEQIVQGDGIKKSDYVTVPSVRDYLYAATDGQLVVDFSVFGPYSSSVSEELVCEFPVVQKAGQDAAANDGIDLQNYGAVFYVTDEYNENCGYLGRRLRGTDEIVMNGTDPTNANEYVHELGHAWWELPHANGYDFMICGDLNSTTDDCTKEGIDYYDPMNHDPHNDLTYGLNAPHKIALGLIKPEDILTITESGVYEVIGSEIEGQGTHVLKIKKPNSHDEYYYLEYMQPLQFPFMSDEEWKKKVDSAYGNELNMHVWNGDPAMSTQQVRGIQPNPHKNPHLFTDETGTFEISFYELGPEKAVLEITFHSNSTKP